MKKVLLPQGNVERLASKLKFASSKLSYLYSRGNGPRRVKTCLRGFGKKKGADQPAHPRSLISAFVIGLLESIISGLATSEISIF